MNPESVTSQSPSKRISPVLWVALGAGATTVALLIYQSVQGHDQEAAHEVAHMPSFWGLGIFQTVAE